MYCPNLTPAQLADHLRTLIGLSVEIDCNLEGRQVGAGPQLLIGVTAFEQTGSVYADLVEGWGIQIAQDGLIIKVTDADENDAALFADCYNKGYYPNLPLNDRLQSIIAWSNGAVI